MVAAEERLEKIYGRIEKLLSLQIESNHKLVELESVNQQLNTKIKSLEAQVLRAKKDGMTIDSEKQKINLQNKQEINHKINELLSEVERCMALLKR